MAKGHILVIDDEQEIFDKIKKGLGQAHELYYASSLPKVRHIFAQYPIDLAFVDLNLQPTKDNPFIGLDYIRIIRQRYPTVILIVLSGYRDIERIVEATQNGADDYFYKGKWRPNSTTFKLDIQERIKAKRKQDEDRAIWLQEAWGAHAFSASVLQQIKDFGHSGESFLLIGEEGLGQPSLVNRLYAQSHRFGKVKTPVSLDLNWYIEREWLKYARLNHAKREPNPFWEAQEGILFLRGVEHSSLRLQQALLEMITRQKFLTSAESFVAQLILGVEGNPAQLIKEGQLSSALYQALDHLELAPLRERRETIPELIRHWQRRHNYTAVHVPEVVLEQFERYHYPGNVSELYAYLKQAFADHARRYQGRWKKKPLELESLPSAIRRALPAPREDLAYEWALVHLRHIEWQFKRFAANRRYKSLTAKALGAHSADNLKKTYIDKYWAAYPELVACFPRIMKAYKFI